MLTLTITTLLREESCLKFAEGVAEVLGVRDLRSIACEVWSRRFQLKLCISDIPFNCCKSLLRDIVAHYAIMTSLYVWNLILSYI